jgi:toxin ParE1/3/4
VKSRLTPEAELDLIEAIRWYDERDQKLGDDFLRRIYHCIGSLERNPDLYPVFHRQMRRALVRRFPYQILYEIENDEIIIYAIYHSSRDPEVWKRRGND